MVTVMSDTRPNGHTPEVTGHTHEITGHMLQISGHTSIITGHMSQISGHTFKISPNPLQKLPVTCPGERNCQGNWIFLLLRNSACHEVRASRLCQKLASTGSGRSDFMACSFDFDSLLKTFSLPPGFLGAKNAATK